MFGRRPLPPRTLDLLSAGAMIPSCILVSWLLWRWMSANGWVGETTEVWFVLFGIGTGIYNFLKTVLRQPPPSGNGDRGDEPPPP